MNVFTGQDVLALFGDDMTLPKEIADLLNEGDFLAVGQLICDKILKMEEEAAELGLSNDDPDICSACNGSGEGMFDGSTCGSCGGSGSEPQYISDCFDEPEEPICYPENYQGDY